MTSRTIKYVPLDEIVEADLNPKLHDIPAIDRSIDRLGFGEPPLLDMRTGQLVAGHGRIEALRQRKDRDEPPPDGVRVTKGIWLVPVVHGWSSLDDQHAAAYLIGSNQTTMSEGWDPDMMAELLAPLDEDMIETAGIVGDVLHARRNIQQ